MNINTPIKIRDEKNLSREVLRALKFMRSQLKKGWNMTEVLHHIENSYGERVTYFLLLSFKDKL